MKQVCSLLLYFLLVLPQAVFATDWEGVYNEPINMDTLDNVVDGTELEVTGQNGIYVAEWGLASLDIINGGRVTAYAFDIGNRAAGDVTVSGGSRLTVGANGIGIGNWARSTLDITGGSQVSSSGNITLGAGTNATSQGIVTVDGVGSLLQAGDDLQIGNRGEGFLSITNGGVVTGNRVIWSASENTRDGAGYVTVDGVGSLLEAITNLRVRIGTLDITNGGMAKGDWVSIGTVDHSASVRVDGEDSLLYSTGDMEVGNAGTGTLTLTNGARAQADGNIRIGYDNFNANGTVYVDETSSFTAGGDITVGFSGQRPLGGGMLAGTGQVTAGGDIKVGNHVNNAIGILSAGNAAGEVGTLNLTADNLILGIGSVLRVDSNSNGDVDLINVKGNVEVGTKKKQNPAFPNDPSNQIDVPLVEGDHITVDLGSLRTITPDAILQADTLITEYSDFDYNDFVNFTLNGVDLDNIVRLTSENVKLERIGNTLFLTAYFGGAENRSLYWNGGNGYDWNMTQQNWRDTDSNADYFLSGDAVHFSGAQASQTITGNAAPSYMDVTNGTWEFTGDLAVDDRLWVNDSSPTLPGGHTSSLKLMGDADVTLSGNNSFRKGIETASGSTLRLKNQNAAGTQAISNDGTLVLDFKSEYKWQETFNNDIRGTGSINKDGAYAVTMTGAVQNGALSINAGTLNFDSTSAPTFSGNVSVASGATLGLRPGGPALNAGSVTAAPGAILNLTSYSGAGQHTLIETTDGINGDFVMYVAGELYKTRNDSFMDVSLVKSGTDLLLDQALVWNRSAAAHGLFNIASGEFTINEALADNTIVKAGEYHNWDGKSLTKSGAGTLTLSGANSYTGDTTIEEGRLVVDGTLGSGNYAGAIANSGELVFDQSANQSLSGVISGTGSLSKTGVGTVILTSANSYTGDTTIEEGRLVVGGTLGGGNYAGAIANSGELVFDQSANQNLSSVISGTGSLSKSGTGTLTLSAANSFTGALAVEAGTVKLDTGASLQANALFLGTNALFDYSAAGAYASSSPTALKNMTVYGLGASISPGAGGADFTGGNLVFDIPSSAVADSVLLTVNGDADMTGASIALESSSVRPGIAEGEKVILLDVIGMLENDFVTVELQTLSGDTYTVQINNNQLEAILEEISPLSPAYERLKAYAESRTAGLAFVNQGMDLLLNQGLSSALAMTSGSGSRFSTFASMGSGWSRYASGSHVDVSGTSFLAGFALGDNIANGRLTTGMFFEGGWGNYDSHNSFSNAASVGGKGDTSYQGGGILGRYDLTQGSLAGFYVDASLRVGMAETNFRTGDIKYNSWSASFDSSSPYYGLHGGVGFARNLTDKASIDLSAKLLWTRQKGDSLTVYQDAVRFEDADSLRTRLGGRFAYTINDSISPYTGMYWEHEFDGEANSTVNGQSIDAPSIQGSTGMGELGLTVTPSANMPLSIDFGVQGYIGKREGVSGNVQVKAAF